ncbi:uncharacterized protein FA14DRAFT_93039 [Meira miltonrushii]|uniref:CENP-V/GFA domain-containing protein n=1 Tax=Meira miltonrushii TaxID=1280837 RepID=A0A316V3G5_9BASI|nr:uncharacterized protein FA14DRAFT_93039 [Meira miltonrushii]PWN31794.1 hypothetical protein FA14DRAFT_93039 [Meira miltonrushii]
MTSSHSAKQSSLPLAGLASDGWTKEKEATATCFCGGVQMVFPTEKPGLVDTFVCNCTDCRKITASMFASNFIAKDEFISFVRGENQLKQFAQSKTIESGNTMTNHFCGNCGTLMFRVSSGAPDAKIMRIGTIDDFALQETKLKPRIEQYTKDRSNWCAGARSAEQHEGAFYKL